jgi:ribonuclease HII
MDETPRTKYGLFIYQNPTPDILEIGIDEAGKGPMFGRVYAAAVILPKENERFNHEDLRDSKKISSTKKINKIAEYIKKHAQAWAVCYEDETTIDSINIRQATFRAMHSAVTKVMDQLTMNDKAHLIVDGNDFKPYMYMKNSMLTPLPHTCYEGGDNKFTAIAAASILAKTERDKYIMELCENHPELMVNYSIHTNKGYGTQ